MRLALILAPVLILSAAPTAMAKPCSTICRNPAAHTQTYRPAAPVYKKADHSHVSVYNGGAQNVTTMRGVRVMSPAPLYNNRQQTRLAAEKARTAQAEAEQALSLSQARLAAAQTAEASARLSAIEAKQDLILERQKRRAQPRRRAFYGNNRFFGANGFIGNSNFSGATVPAKRTRKRRRSSH